MDRWTKRTPQATPTRISFNVSENLGYRFPGYPNFVGTLLARSSPSGP